MRDDRKLLPFGWQHAGRRRPQRSEYVLQSTAWLRTCRSGPTRLLVGWSWIIVLIVLLANWVPRRTDEFRFILYLNSGENYLVICVLFIAHLL